MGVVMDTAERKFWGKVPPERRGVWGRFLRTRRGDRPVKDVLATLAAMNAGMSPAYYSDFETGKVTPSEEWQLVFIRLYGTGPSEDEPLPTQEVHPEPDLAAAIRGLTEAVRDQMAAADQREERLTDRMVAVLEALGLERGAAGGESELHVPGDAGQREPGPDEA